MLRGCPMADMGPIRDERDELRARAERAETERDEARRVLLAIADDVYGHPYRYTVGMLRRVLGIPFSGVEVSAPDIRAAIYHLCKVRADPPCDVSDG